MQYMKFTVKLNTADGRVKFGKSDHFRFGANNEGFEIEAETMAACRDILQKPVTHGGYNLNPFYLIVIPEKETLERVINTPKVPAGFKHHARELLAGRDP